MYFDGDVPFVCPADLAQSLRITAAARGLARKAVTDGRADLFPRGTVLLVGIGSTVGKVGLVDADFCTNQQITGLTFRSGVSHGCAAIDQASLWDTVPDDAPTLLAAVRQTFEDLERSTGN